LPGYEKHQLLGRGACAVVWLATPSTRSGYVAIKQVAKGTTCKKKSDVDAARKEILFADFLFNIPGGTPKVSQAEYPGIAHLAKLIEYMETKRDIWLVMEYGGTCLTKMAYEIKGEFLRGERLYRVLHLPLLASAKQDSRVLRRLLHQLLSALVVLADHYIVHSDIKPDNILIDEDEHGRPKARFIDFGSSFAFDRPDSLALATPEYMPPEALESCASRSLVGAGASRLSLGRNNGRKPSDPAVKLHHQANPWSFDIWSLGSILLELSLGAPLWLSYKSRVADDNRAFSASTGLFAVPGRDPEKIRAKQADALCQRGLHRVLHDPAGVVLDADGIDLLARMLAWNPVDRISPQEAMKHPWLTNLG
jgi:serine/threonine protein kinase